MKNLLFAGLAMFMIVNTAYASEGYEYKGSHAGFSVTAETAVLQMIESQTDPKTEKVEIDGKALKFEYFENNFPQVGSYLVGAVHLSDNDDQYVFDYYVDGDKVVKIVLITKNDEEIVRQVYPEKTDSPSDRNR